MFKKPIKKFKKIVVATGNPSKVKYYGSVLKEIADQVVGLSDLNIIDKPLESGDTSEENAEIKAKFYAQKAQLPVFCEDEALYVDFLPASQQPATHVRRVNGKDEVDDDKLIAHWEEILSKVPENRRTGRWHITYCIALPNGTCKSISLDHFIKFFSPTSKIRLLGWPMSSLQGAVELNKPHSERTNAETELAKKRTLEEIRKVLVNLV